MSESEREEITRLLRLNEVHVWPDYKEFLHCFHDIGKAVVGYPRTRDTCTTRFVQYCRQITNRSPMRHLRALRLEKARRLLLDHPAMSVIDVAMECGFSSSQYFASCFGRELGTTPSAYRQAGAAAVLPC